MKSYRRYWTWIGLGLLALLLRMLLGPYPGVVEQYYSRGLFLSIRWAIDYGLAWLPFPLMYLFVAFLIFFLVRSIRKWWREGHDLVRGVLGPLAFLGGVLFFFLFLWGFNYARIPIEDQLGLDPQPLNKEELGEALATETARIIQLRRQIPGAAEDPLDRSSLPPHLEDELREDLRQWLKENNFPTPGRVRGRLLFPKGIFLRFSSAGLYWPFTGEGHADAGLHPLQLPAVLAHELGHGYGFGDEGTCSFLAYVSCDRSENPYIRYAGHLDHWRTLAGHYRRYAPEDYNRIWESLPAGIQADLNAIYETMRRYPDILPRVRYLFYDNYLKVQGIHEGMKNYSRVIMLVKAWQDAREPNSAPEQEAVED